MTDFQGLAPALAEALRQKGFTGLTPVQNAVLDPKLGEADALVSAQTGSGKTVAFGLAMASTLLGEATSFGLAAEPLALIVAPTRELALQVRRELEWLYSRTGAVIASCVGGMDARTERRALERGAQIVVGTPGRLRDHIERGALDLSGLRVAVLDEADEMLDLGFREDLEFILEAAPAERRTLLFSATVSRPIAALATRYQRDAVRITTLTEREQHLDIDYRALNIAPGDRDHAIINLLRYHEPRNALVFCGTRATVNHLTARMTNRGLSVVALSGELSQTERSHALQAMRDGRARVCIATDVAARGIDLPGLELVIHADLPGSKEALLHRSGRTGRAGQKGISALIVEPRDRRKAERLLQLANITPTWDTPPTPEAILKRDEERLLADPMLTDPVGEDEAAMAAKLLAAHGAEQIAAALVRLVRAGKSAPEELKTPGSRDAQRPEFGESVWFRLSAGRNQQADPRWLLPLLCRAGNVTRRDIGAIRLAADVSYVQILKSSAGTFRAALGPDGMLEQGITAEDSDGPAEAPAPRYDGDKPKPHGKKPYAAAPGKKPYAPRTQPAEGAVAAYKPKPKPAGEGFGKAPAKGPSKGPAKAPGKAKYAKAPNKPSTHRKGKPPVK